MNDGERSLTIVNALAEVERAAAWLEEVAGQAALPTDTANRLQVVLDEILANIINHSLADAAPGMHDISLALSVAAGRVELTFIDDGPEFDPTLVEAVPVAARVASRQIGGAGLVFVRALMDDIRYARIDGRNRLVVRKYITTPNN